MVLNDKQRTVLIAGIAVFILMGLFPPWTLTVENDMFKAERPGHYGFIAVPPAPPNDRLGLKLNFSRLAVQWIMVVMATGVGVFLTSNRSKQ